MAQNEKNQDELSKVAKVKDAKIEASIAAHKLAIKALRATEDIPGMEARLERYQRQVKDATQVISEKNQKISELSLEIGNAKKQKALLESQV